MQGIIGAGALCGGGGDRPAPGNRAHQLAPKDSNLHSGSKVLPGPSCATHGAPEVLSGPAHCAEVSGVTPRVAPGIPGRTDPPTDPCRGVGQGIPNGSAAMLGASQYGQYCACDRRCGTACHGWASSAAGQDTALAPFVAPPTVGESQLSCGSTLSSSRNPSGHTRVTAPVPHHAGRRSSPPASPPT